MLTPEDNEAITRVGAGTVMGDFMREYWLPAMLSSELPTPDCNPVRVKMLGEDLIGFRDTSGRVGVIANLCPHRGTSLFLGRNEENGIRCVYHGWKFDVHGTCTDMPNEPAESNFKRRVKATTYPCEERAGLVFVYMGSREVPPQLPDIEGLRTPAGGSVTATMVPCNWLQVLEGNIDTVHAAILHSGSEEPEWFPEGSGDYYQLKNRAAKFVAVDVDGGALYGAYRPGPPGFNYWRIGKFNFPCWTSPGVGFMGHKINDVAWVPMDDTHTLAFRINGRIGDGQRPPTGDGNREQLLPNTTGWYGRFNTVYNEENDFLINREEQAELATFTGMPLGVGNEDSAVQVLMGSILPREIEHLGTSDLMIIRVRQRLLDAARANADHKSPPPGVDNPELYLGRTGSILIPEDADWLEYTAEYREAFTDHGSVDPVFSAPSIYEARGHGRRHRRTGSLF